MHFKNGDNNDTDTSDEGASDHSNDISKIPKDITKTGSSSSSTWQYFEIMDNDQFVAKCKVCAKEISYDTVSQLTEHAKEHSTLVSEDEEWLDNKDRFMRKHGRRSNASAVWNFMEIIDDNAKNAVCLLCRRQLSFLTGTSNLRKHIGRIHPDINIEEGRIESDDKKVIISTNGQFYEIATSDGEKDPIPTDEVYLEEALENESIGRINNDIPSKRMKFDDKIHSKKKLVSMEVFQDTKPQSQVFENTSDISKMKTSKTNTRAESLNIFGQYVSSLLQQLPEYISDQLQSDFIKQIFAAKIALKTPHSVTLNEKPITVTINSGTSTSIPVITVQNSDVLSDANTCNTTVKNT